MATKRRTIKTKPRAKSGGRPTRAKSGSNSNDIKAMVTQMARAAIKSQTSNYQGSSTVLGNLGMMAGNGISKIFGLGAYKLQSNSLFDSKTSSQVPFMHSSDESIVFRHREYIGEISSSVAFVANTFPVNPGLSQTFPYLQSIASSFQEYKFRGLVFEFRSTGATALVSGTNTAMGAVMLAAQYRADAPAFTSKVELLNEMWSVDSKTSDNCLLPIECSPKENAMSIQYVRTGAPTGDIKLYDLCNVTVATQGSQAANIVGELWVSYEIEFYKPAVTPTGGVLAAFHASGTGDAALPFGIGHVVKTDTFPIVGITSNGFTLPPFLSGRFQVVIYHFGAAAVYAPGVFSVSPNIIPANVINGNPFGNAPAVGVNSTDCIQSAYFQVDPVGTNSFISIANGVYPAGGVVEIFLIELPDSLH